MLILTMYLCGGFTIITLLSNTHMWSVYSIIYCTVYTVGTLHDTLSSAIPRVFVLIFERVINRFIGVKLSNETETSVLNKGGILFEG